MTDEEIVEAISDTCNRLNALLSAAASAHKISVSMDRMSARNIGEAVDTIVLRPTFFKRL